jgi:UDP-glucuronate decarboxylase
MNSPGLDFDGPIVVTGPTGWCGRALVAWWADRIGPAWRDRLTLFASRARTETGPDGLPVDFLSLTELRASHLEGALLYHLAFAGREKAAEMGDSPFFVANLAIDDAVLSALRGARPRGVFVTSSGAAADAASGVDRHPYGLAKLFQEERFLRLARDRELKLVVGRLFSVAGPFINKLNDYALASFILQAFAKGRIEVKASAPVFRSFIHVYDVATIATGLLLEDRHAPTQPIDLCGPQVVEIGDLARAVATAVGLGPDAVVRAPIDYTRASVYLGSPTPTLIAASRLGCSLRSFEQQIADTVRWLDLDQPQQGSRGGSG